MAAACGLIGGFMYHATELVMEIVGAPHAVQAYLLN